MHVEKYVSSGMLRCSCWRRRDTSLALLNVLAHGSIASYVRVITKAVNTNMVMAAGDWKRMADFDKMLIMRVLRADRLMSAMSRFVSGVLGPEFVTSQAFDLERSYQVRVRNAALHCIL